MTPFHEMHHRARKRVVNAVRVYGIGRAVDWDCTCEEIAKELGLTPRTVADICRDRGWKTTGQKATGGECFAVDSEMKRRDTVGSLQ